MTFWKKYCAIAILALFPQIVMADGWSGLTYIVDLNIGGNSQHGTFFGLEGYAFSGCNNPNVGFLDAADENYKEILAAMLAAKMAQKQINVLTVGCALGGNFSRVDSIIVP